MVIEVKNKSKEEILKLLEKKSPKKSFSKHFGALKRGIDGLQYQKEMRKDED
jgi:hypothetical protein